MASSSASCSSTASGAGSAAAPAFDFSATDDWPSIPRPPARALPARVAAPTIAPSSSPGTIAPSSSPGATASAGALDSSRAAPTNGRGRYGFGATNRSTKYWGSASSSSTATGLEGFETAPDPTISISPAVSNTGCFPTPLMPASSSSSATSSTPSRPDRSPAFTTTPSAVLPVSAAVPTAMAEAVPTACSTPTSESTSAPAQAPSLSTTFAGISTALAPLQVSSPMPATTTTLAASFTPSGTAPGRESREATAPPHRVLFGHDRTGRRERDTALRIENNRLRAELAETTFRLLESRRTVDLLGRLLQAQPQRQPASEQCWDCHVKRAVVRFIRCRHVCLCVPCYVSRQRCPSCRSWIDWVPFELLHLLQ